MVVRQEKIKVTDTFQIPISLSKYEEDGEPYFVIDIDGVEWLCTENQVHAVVLFDMMREHITEYYNYKPRS